MTLLLGLCSSAALAQAPAPMDSCAQCHAGLTGLENEKLSQPVKLFATDVHKESGLGCVDCHGGDRSTMDVLAAKDPRRGFVARPESRRVGLFCGKCHSDLSYMRKYNPKARVDQWTEYLTSVHGQKNQAGDPLAATCVSCHGVHNIKTVSNPTSPVYPTNVAATCARCHSDQRYMSRYGIATDQMEKYQRSVHAEHLMEKRDLSAPTCNDCHGNHGAAPPGVASVSYVCGQCHTRQQRLFNDSPHQQMFEEAGLSACTTCHENHAVARPTDEMLGTGDEGVCISCHSSGEKGYLVGEQMLQAILGLRGRLEEAGQIVGRAERAGMEVSGARFKLSEAHESLIQSRVLVHGVSAPDLLSVIGEGMKTAEESLNAGIAALQEIDYRRRGLLASLVFILMAALGLFLKIRKMES